MRIGFLVGACGLALAGAAHAERASLGRSASDTLDNDFVRARDAVVGKPGTAQRLAYIDQAREKIRTGQIDPRRSLLADISDEVFAGDARQSQSVSLSGGLDRAAPTVGNPNPWAADIGMDDFHTGFEEYVNHVSLGALADLRQLGGQAAPNGNNWLTGTPVYNGVVDDAVAQSGSGVYTGPPGGPDPMGLQINFMSNPRGSVLNLTTTAFNTSFEWVCRLTHQFYVPTASTPVITVVDWYVDTLETFTWFRPVSPPEGFIVTNMFIAGYDFATFAVFATAQNILTRPIMLGPKPGSFLEGEFFVAATHTIQTREWFNIALRQASDSFSVWMRDSTTIGTYGFTDDSQNMYSGDTSAPGDGIIPYEDEIFENDFVMWYPGLNDDPMTVKIEGSGIAVNTFGQEATPLNDAQGYPSGAVFVSFGVGQLQVVGGFDWGPAFIPGYAPDDWYLDNYTVMGEPFSFADPQPDTTLPYFDDSELWTPGPVAIQGNRWFDSFSFSEVVDTQNHTMGIGLDGDPNPVQSFRNVNIFGNTVYRDTINLELFEEDFLARAGSVTPLVHSQWMLISDNLTSRGFDAIGGGFRSSRVFIGGRDSNGIVDNIVYIDADNPDHDNALPNDDISGANEIWDGVQNRPNYPAPLETAGGVAATWASGVFNQVSVSVLVNANDLGDAVVSVNGTPMVIDADFFTGLGGQVPVSNDAGIRISEIEWETGAELGGLLSTAFWDDIFIDGLRELEPTVLQVTGLPYTAHPLFALPYVDPFDGYTYELPFSGQGATPFLGEVFTSNVGNQVDTLPLTGAVSMGDPVFHYKVSGNGVVSQPGTLPAGMTGAIGEDLFVFRNFPNFRDPLAAAVPGQVGASRRVNIRNNSLQLQAAVDMTLQSATTMPYAGGTVIGRYFFIFENRWGGDPTEPFVIDNSPDPRGNILVITQDFISGDSDAGELDDAVVSTLPRANARPGEHALLEVDLFIGTDWDRDGDMTPETPRGRTALDIRGPSVEEFQISRIVFGGPNIYIDGDMDGTPDNDTIDDAEDDGTGVHPPATAGIYVLRPNPFAANPPGVNMAAGFDTPVNQWFRAIVRVGLEGDWEFEIDDFSRAIVFGTSGTAVDVTGGVAGLSGLAGLDIMFGNDNGGQGRTRLPKITWTTLGAAATAEAGTDPHNNQFNSVPPVYFYQEVLFIDAAKTPVPADLPDVTEIDFVAGTVVGTRDLAVNDIVVFWNDTDTLGQGGDGALPGSGITLADNNPRNPEWVFTTDLAGMNIASEGNWGALGLPGDAGLNDPVPPGGITNAGGPPYTALVPFRTLLMGTIIDLPAFPPAVDPHQVLVDNVFLNVEGCLWDISPAGGDGTVDGADLAQLLALWGTANPLADINGDGNVDGADLASLLANWGPC